MEKKEVAHRLGERLRNKIAETGENHSQFAKRVGLTKATLSNYLNGRSEPSLSMLLLLSNILGTNPNYLLGVEEQKLTNEEQEPANYHSEDKVLSSLFNPIPGAPPEQRLDYIESHIHTNDELLTDLLNRLSFLEKNQKD